METDEIIKKLDGHDSYGCIDTHQLGELCAFSLQVKDAGALELEFGKPVEEVPQDVYLKTYLRFVFFPKNSLREGHLKPEHPVLTSVDTAKLTNDDVNKLSALVTEHSSYLWSELFWGTKEEIEDKRLHEKNTNESDADFLYRLLVIKNQKERAHTEMMMGKNIFSTGLGERIKETLGIGDKLRRFVEPTSIKFETIIPEHKFLELKDTNAELLAEISGRMNALIDATRAAATFAVTANEIHTQIAAELKSSSDQSGLYAKENIVYAKKNVHLTGWVIFITICSIGLPLILTLKGQSDAVNDTKEQKKLIEENVSLIASRIIELRDTVASVRDGDVLDLKNQIGHAQNAVEALKAENAQLLRLRDADIQTMKELKESFQKLQQVKTDEGQATQGKSTK